MQTSRVAIAGVLAWILAGVPATPVWARFAEPDSTFLRSQEAAIEAMAAGGMPKAQSPEGAVEVIRGLLARRDAALRELGKTLPLTQLDGIETQDRYDGAVVDAVNRIAAAAVAADSTLPPEQEAILFQKRLGPMPELGDKPVAFMVLGAAGDAVAGADSARGDPGLSPGSADKLALRLILHGTTVYRRSHDDLIMAAKADGFRQTSVILRMRCPQDGGSYRVTDMKNKIEPDGSIATLYYIKCNICYAPDVVAFPQVLASRLNKAADRQKLKDKPKPARPTEDLKQ